MRSLGDRNEYSEFLYYDCIYKTRICQNLTKNVDFKGSQFKRYREFKFPLIYPPYITIDFSNISRTQNKTIKDNGSVKYGTDYVTKYLPVSLVRFVFLKIHLLGFYPFENQRQYSIQQCKVLSVK